MVWGCISKDKVFPLVRIDTRINGEEYKKILKKFFESHFGPPPTRRSTVGRSPPTWTFQHDNAAVHTSKVVEKYLKNRRAVVLPWPSNSPDLNPIENLWGLLTSKVYSRALFPNVESLWQAIQAEWNQIDVPTLHSLYNSMGRRMEAVRVAHGYPTPY